MKINSMGIILNFEFSKQEQKQKQQKSSRIYLYTLIYLNTKRATIKKFPSRWFVLFSDCLLCVYCSTRRSYEWSQLLLKQKFDLQYNNNNQKKNHYFFFLKFFVVQTFKLIQLYLTTTNLFIYMFIYLLFKLVIIFLFIE